MNEGNVTRLLDNIKRGILCVINAWLLLQVIFPDLFINDKYHNHHVNYPVTVLRPFFCKFWRHITFRAIASFCLIRLQLPLVYCFKFYRQTRSFRSSIPIHLPECYSLFLPLVCIIGIERIHFPRIFPVHSQGDVSFTRSPHFFLYRVSSFS